MDPLLKTASLLGDVDKLYQVIRKDPHALELVDKLPLAETPLHIAASRGHINFAVEIMRLKPSLSKKQEGDGLTPMHLALRENQTKTVHRLLETDADLVRVKGREGFTPLHYVVEQEDVKILHEFLEVSPGSITDTTNRGETALHIAVKKGKTRALETLLAFLRRSWYREALYWEEKVLNWKDENGYTALHVAAMNNDVQMIKLLLNCNIHVNARSLNGSTVLDIVSPDESKPVNTEMKDLLIRAGALHGDSIQINDSATISMKQLSF